MTSYVTLTAIQNMKFFLHTAFGDSKDLVGARVELKAKGYMEGNRAPQVGWAVVSIAILMAHKQWGHGAIFLCPISDAFQQVSTIMYDNDTDSLHINMTEDESIVSTHAALQHSIDNCSQLLIAIGSSLKPEKCFFYLISYKWKRDGTWSYSHNELRHKLGITVSLPRGSEAAIEHLAIDTPLTTLGITTCPSASPSPAIITIKEKALQCAHAVTTSRLGPKAFHFIVKHKFCPKVK
jgi:hypothetical protein